MMDTVLSLNRWLPWRRRDEAEPRTETTARFGGDDGEEPVLVATIQGPVEGEIARDALRDAGIPAYIKENKVGRVYGLTIGSFGAAEVWVMPVWVEQARDTLIGVGLLPEPESPDDP